MKFGNITINEDQIIDKTEFSYVFVNIRPFMPYHVLVVPIRCEMRFKNLKPEELNDIMTLIHKLVSGLDSLGDAWSVILQDGEAAGQSIPHVHFHLVPRNKNDLERNDDIYVAFEEGYERRNRSIEEMKKEADYLRDILKTAKK